MYMYIYKICTHMTHTETFDYIYITLVLLLWDLNTMYVMNHF